MSELLQKIGNEVAFENFFELNFEFIQEFLEKIDLHSQKKFAELLFPLYHKHNKLKPFLIWAVKQEVKQTSEEKKSILKKFFLHISLKKSRKANSFI